MKKVLVGILAVLATVSVASAISVPLPPIDPVNGSNMSMDAFGAFSEVFIEVKQPLQLPTGVLAPGTYNNIAIGWSQDADPTTSGNQPDFVLYTGAASTVGGPPVPGNTIVGRGAGLISDLLSGKGQFAGVTQGRLYVGGVVESITTTQTVQYNKGRISGSLDPNPNPQLTFSMYNAYITNLSLNPSVNPLFGGTLETEFELSPVAGKELHFDVWADNTVQDGTAGTLGGVPTSVGQRYRGVAAAVNATPELPVRDQRGNLLVNIDDGTYYDRTRTGWGEIAFAGDPLDDDAVFWSFVGNPNSQMLVDESFNVRAAEFFIAPDGTKVFTSGPSSTIDPTVGPNFSIIGQLIPGQSLAPAAKTNGGVGYGNNLLADDYAITANFRFGGGITGAYDSDPNTFSFQQGEPGSIGTLTQLEGRLTTIPEPVTMIGLMMAAGSLGSYVLKRKRA
jgi:hypothetical protein